jgi:hypothetical protein
MEFKDLRMQSNVDRADENILLEPESCLDNPQDVRPELPSYQYIPTNDSWLTQMHATFDITSQNPHNMMRGISGCGNPEYYPNGYVLQDPKKKRHKNDLYHCKKCDKTYLSYPALYTHNKLKHLRAEESQACINGRTRGRPRKVTVILFF